MPDASLVFNNAYRVFFLAFLKLSLPRAQYNPPGRRDHKADNPHISRYFNAVLWVFSLHSIRLVTAVVTGNITASTANTFIKIDTGIDSITAV